VRLLTKEMVFIMNELGTCYKCDEPAYVTVGWQEQTDHGTVDHVDKVCEEHLHTHPAIARTAGQH
jgi:hypothetical protein